ncbi:U11/U12 small nuclear ribonucleoprotein [Danaus plexippus plexippus]|uniref:U11/U12 small nuclear ribonucleoprotein n=1 Tax=Danaus plexippus plexippus TaxID=278856 RepID=A0A212EJA4_DANPL|nr:U11/U12 small nuclear ribonucleoprotein 25 kDa protein-like [Danaus plexippus plexippus]OWR41566.1 U11/U12 small nuclear ribonucleoprotein [Danaus plexippus plexippus]
MDEMISIAKEVSHDEVLEITKSLLSTLFKSDSLLSDLPSDIILEEILSQTAVEHGQSITVIVSREDEQPLKVIVPQNSTVRELKKAVARHFELYQQRMGNRVKISWRYIWKTYSLNYDSLTLDKDDSKITDYGVTNKVILTFKKIRRKPR